MRKYFLIAFILASIHSEAQCTFERIYKYYLPTISFKPYLAQISEGGFLSVMSCYNTVLSSGNTTDMAIVKIDSCGNTLWKQLYGEPGINDDASGCIETQDGNLLIAGTTEKGPALANFRAIKLSKNGQLIWDSVYTGTHESSCMGMTKRKNQNSFFLYGYTWNRIDSLTSGYYALLLEIDDKGNILKRKDFNIPRFYYIVNIIQSNDSTYDLFMVSFRDTLYFVQMDTAFNVKINKPLIYPHSRYLSSCLSKDSKSILLLADYDSATFPMNRTLFKTDLNGNIIKQINYFNPFVGDTLIYAVNTVASTIDNGYIIAGGYFMKLDSNLNIQKILGYNKARGSISSVIQLPDKSIVGSGISNLLDTANWELYIIKLNENGGFAHLGINEPRNTVTPFINIYPNPTSNVLNIQTSSTEKLNVQLFDITGKNVSEIISFTNNTSINTSYLSKGIYFLKCISENSITTKKIVIE